MNSALSVVIPALNASKTLPGCLGALRAGSHLIREIIVVDGGSADATIDCARAAGATVINAPASRGGQLRAGAAASSGKFLLLLHADTVLSNNWPDDVTGFISQDRAGYFRLRLNSPQMAARILERLAALRCRLFRLPYGDQGLLISQTLLTAIGGVPDLPLMEDVAMARRLGKQRLQPLTAQAVTSATRYERGGWVRRPLRNLVCLTLYSCGVPPGRILKIYG